MTDFRVAIPERRENPRTLSNYRNYKRDLREDFKNSCGYCGDEDSFTGGFRTYQIDHFVPKKEMVNLCETDYSNLVYSCFYCNNKKSSDWPTGDETVHNNGEEGYIDPCHDHYPKQFKRNELGKIISITPLGAYMHSKLNFYLRRHALIWLLTRISNNIVRLNELKEFGSLDEEQVEFTNLLIEYFKDEYYQHNTELRIENNE